MWNFYIFTINYHNNNFIIQVNLNIGYQNLYCIIIDRKNVFNQLQHFNHFNLSISLLLGLILFVSGIETANNLRVSNHFFL